MSANLYRPRSCNQELRKTNERRRIKQTLSRWVRAHVRTDYRDLMGMRR